MIEIDILPKNQIIHRINDTFQPLSAGPADSAESHVRLSFFSAENSAENSA